MVRPGITGWAQVNGGTLLTAAEKADLDGWYIRHASAALDLRIVLRTVKTALRGQTKSHEALRQARSGPYVPSADCRPDWTFEPTSRHV
jgi:hypothetical protein